jgi:ribosome recycling factor
MTEIIADLKAKMPNLTPEERKDMSRTVDKFIEMIMKDVHRLAHNAMEALTSDYREVWETILERRLAWVSELERIKALLQ